MGFELFIEAVNKKKDLTFCFVGHAQCENSALGKHGLINYDDPLTEEGHRQAEAVGAYLAALETPVSAIYTSTQQHTKETAEAIAKATKVEVTVSDRLVERDWGEYDHYTYATAFGQLDQMTFEERFTFVPPGGESWQEMSERVFGVLTMAAEVATDGDTIVVISHFGPLRGVLTLLDGKPPEEHKSYFVSEGGISIFRGGQPSLELFNHQPFAVE